MYFNEDESLKNDILQIIKPIIKSWNDDSIYAISLFVDNDECTPSKPIFKLGYNTENDYTNAVLFAENELEARWNYAYWRQNQEFVYGTGETSEIVHRWIVQKGFPEYTYKEIAASNFNDFEKLELITKSFFNILVNVVKELHQSNFIKQNFSKEIPVIIHKLEYYPEIALKNIEANSASLVKGFVDFINEQ